MSETKSDLNINLHHKNIEEKFRIVEIIDEMLAQSYELNCGKVGEGSTDPDLFFAMFFREPPNWRETNDHLYLEAINYSDNAGHGATLLEAIEQAKEISLKKGL